MYIRKNIFALSLTIGIIFASGGCRSSSITEEAAGGSNQSFRDESVKLAREAAGSVFSGARTSGTPEELAIEGSWGAAVDVYSRGEIASHGQAENRIFAQALELAAREAAEILRSSAEPAMVGTRLVIYAGRSRRGAFSFVEYQGKGLELVSDLTTVRYLDKAMIKEKIAAGKGYLLRSMNPEKHAFYKKYYVLENTFGNKLRTIYTASSLLTLMKMNDMERDERIEDEIPKIADFLISMQSQEGEAKGAFNYSMNADTGEKDGMYVVGTASKTIFTLLDLYRRTNDARYLDTAKLAGEWLLTMQRPNGSVRNYMEYKDGAWVYGEKFSCLYTGQVLSAFSRLYGATEDKRYYEAAEKIAKHISEKAKSDGFFVRDEYRLTTDPVPTSWAVMSLLDFYKVSGDAFCKEVLLGCADKLISIQLDSPEDIMEYGRFQGSIASGTGWIAEILTELYNFGKEKKWEGTDKYERAVVKAVRWLVQNTYSPENTYFISSPERVFGGIIRNYSEETIRTDAVCHGLNGYMGIFGSLGEGPLIEVPETRKIGA